MFLFNLFRSCSYQAWERLKFLLSLLCSIEQNRIFFSLYCSHLVPILVWFCPFKLKMDKFTEQNNSKRSLMTYHVAYAEWYDTKKLILCFIPFNVWNLMKFHRLNEIIYLKVKTALKEMIWEISFNCCLRLFKPTFKNLDLIY